MAETTILITILAMAVVTYLPRVMPAWFLRGKQLPPFIISWLSFVPVAVLAAMLLPGLLIQEEKIFLHPHNLYLWAAVPAAWIAWKKKSLFGTVIVGMLVVALGRFFFGL